MNRKIFLVSILIVTVMLVNACVPATPPPTQAPVETEAAAQPTKPLAPPPTEVPTEPPAPTEPPPPKVLRIADTATFTTWDPAKSFSTEASYMAQFYEQLIRLNPPGSEEKFTPLLAERWEFSEDGKVWTFYLRKDVKFHDGESLTAEAAKKSIEAAKERGGASFIWAPLDTIEVVDDLTVKFNLSYAAPLDLIASSLYGAWIVSPKALDAASADENYFEAGLEAGTGPYMLESYKADQEIVFTRFEDYWGGWKEGQFDKVLVSIVSEAITQQQMLEGGEVDLASRIPNDSLTSFDDKPDYTVYRVSSFFNYVGFFNTLRPPLDNIKVRQALSYAIPYDDVIKVSVQGLGTQSRGPVPAGVWPWSDEVNQYTYDMEKAKQLLTEAGYPEGGFSLKLTYSAENNTEAAFAPLIKDSYAQLGVEVQIEPMLWSQQWEFAKTDPAKAQDMFLVLYWPTYSDAGSDNLWSMFYWTEAPYFNLSYWKNDSFNALVDEAIGLTVTDPVTSQEKYVEAINLLVDEAPGLFFFDTMTSFVIPKHIEGFQYNLNYPFVYYFYYQLSTAQ